MSQPRSLLSTFIKVGSVTASLLMTPFVLILVLAIVARASLETLVNILLVGLFVSLIFGVGMGLGLSHLVKGATESLTFQDKEKFTRHLNRALKSMGYRLQKESQVENSYKARSPLADPIHVSVGEGLATIIAPENSLAILKDRLLALSFASTAKGLVASLPIERTPAQKFKRACLLCSRKLSLRTDSGGICRSCSQAWAVEKSRRAEEERNKAERDRRLRDIPKWIQDGGLAFFAEQITGDSPINMVTIAFWPEETAMVERIGESVALALLTSGFVGRTKQQQFGIVALTGRAFWRIEIGYASNSYTFYDIETIRRKMLRFDLSDLKSQIEYSAKSCVLFLKSRSSARTVATLAFPNKFEHPFTHPFFDYVEPNNERLAFDLATQIGVDV